MMRRRAGIGLLAGVLLAGLVAVPGAPAGAQDMADLPRLGYEINPTQGFVGDELHSQVNPADVSEHCWELSGLSAWDPSGMSVTQLLAAGDISLEQALQSFYWEIQSVFYPVTTYYALLPALAAEGGYTVEEAQQIWESIYGPAPPLDFAGDVLYEFVHDSRDLPPPDGIPDDQDGQNFVNRVGAAFSTAIGFFGLGSFAPQLYPQMFVTTFVDPVTQEMLGEMGNFDPNTGEGTMLVPDLDPGLYAVAAACVFFKSPEEFMASWAEAQVAAWDYSVACAEEGGEFCFPTGVSQAGWADWAAEGGFGALLPALLAPRAIGLDFYCILQDDGYCATPPGPVGLIDDDVLDEFNGDDPGIDPPGAEGPEDHDGTGDLVAVQATPSFTG